MRFDNICEKHVVIFGDSNTFGYNPADDGRYDSKTRYPCLLADYLGDKWRVYEEGLSGRTSVFDDPFTEGLSGIDSITPVLMTHAPVDRLIIMLGTNDTKSRFGSSASLIAKGLKRLTQKAINTDCWRSYPDIILVCPPPIDPAYIKLKFSSEMGSGCDVKSAELPAYLADIAQELQVKFLDAGSISGISMHELDGMHLSPEAHRKLADELMKFF